MNTPDAFFANIRNEGLFHAISTDQLAGINAILAAMAGDPLAYTAYALATSYHETNQTMQPVIEAYWLSEAWRQTHLRYYPYYGRGFVQLTWQKNYQLADNQLNLGGSLMANLNRALELGIAAQVLRKGMDAGWFSAKKFSDYLPAAGTATPAQFASARRIINGLDKNILIAGYATNFQTALQAGGW